VDHDTDIVVLQCDGTADLADRIADAADDEPGCILLDFTLLEEQEGGMTRELSGGRLQEIADAFRMAGMTCRIPLGIRTADPTLLEIVAKAYAGRLLVDPPMPCAPALSDITAKYGLLIRAVVGQKG
jgi:hypothetical protein